MAKVSKEQLSQSKAGLKKEKSTKIVRKKSNKVTSQGDSDFSRRNKKSQKKNGEKKSRGQG